MTRIVIADDHQIFLDGLTSMLEKNENYNVEKTMKNGQEVLDYLKYETPSIVVLDIDMPAPDGLETTKWIKKNKPDIRVLILSMHNNQRKINLAVQAGVDGYILKDGGKQDFIEALNQLSRGETFFAQSVMKIMVKANQADSKHGKTELSKREIEVLAMVGHGLQSKEIGKELFISSTTVDTHLRNIRTKLQIASRMELVVYAKDNGYA